MTRILPVYIATWLFALALTPLGHNHDSGNLRNAIWGGFASVYGIQGCQILHQTFFNLKDNLKQSNPLNGSFFGQSLSHTRADTLMIGVALFLGYMIHILRNFLNHYKA